MQRLTPDSGNAKRPAVAKLRGVDFCVCGFAPFPRPARLGGVMISTVGKFEVSNLTEKFESLLESCDGAKCNMKMALDNEKRENDA